MFPWGQTWLRLLPASPRFLVVAQQDPGTLGSPGLPLQRLQLIKGWTEADGSRQEKVIDLAGNPDSGASVNLQTCEPQGKGFAELCRVWTDTEFDPKQRAFYYSRVVENPSCRWSQRMCAAAQSGLFGAGLYHQWL